MPAFAAAFGRFSIEQLVAAASGQSPVVADPDPLGGGWGAAWCHGDRLATLRSNRPHGSDPEFAQLLQARTDMAAIYFHDQTARFGQREIQPFVRHEGEHVWAFFHLGRIAQPALLDIGPRLPDGPSPSERLFLHVLNHLNLAEPVESVQRALDALPGERELSFFLMAQDVAILNCRHAGRSSLYLGERNVLRVVAPVPTPQFEGLHWSLLSSGTIHAITRQRRSMA